MQHKLFFLKLFFSVGERAKTHSINRVFCSSLPCACVTVCCYRVLLPCACVCRPCTLQTGLREQHGRAGRRAMPGQKGQFPRRLGSVHAPRRPALHGYRAEGRRRKGIRLWNGPSSCVELVRQVPGWHFCIGCGLCCRAGPNSCGVHPRNHPFGLPLLCGCL